MKSPLCECGHEKRDHVSSIKPGQAPTTCKVCLCNRFVAPAPPVEPEPKEDAHPAYSH